MFEFIAETLGEILGFIPGQFAKGIVDSFGPLVYILPIVAGIALAVVLKFI